MTEPRGFASPGGGTDARPAGAAAALPCGKAAPHELGGLSSRWFWTLFAACFVIAAVPIVAVDTLPLVDYPNHLARMHIIIAAPSSPDLSRFYRLDWRPVPNLAIDVLVPLLAAVLPLTWAGKCFLLLTFLLQAGGVAWLHRTLFRRWSVWPLAAFLLLYNRSLLWGFANFLFAVGLMLVASAAWVAWRERAAAWRLPLFAAVSLAIYFAHFFAFGAYALFVLGFELDRLRRRRARTASALGGLVSAASQFVLPALVFLLTLEGSGGAGGVSYSRLVRKIDLMFAIVDNYVPWFDVATLVILLGGLAIGLLRRRVNFAAAMGLPLLLLALAQLAMPNRAFGAAGVDHRMPLVLGLVLIAATAPAVGSWRRYVPAAGALALLFIARIGVVAETWIADEREIAPVSAALEALPRGSRVAVAYPPEAVAVPRRGPPVLHLAALAVPAADAFVPTLFVDPGQQPLRFTAPYAALAALADPDMFWQVLVAHQPDPDGRVAAALRGYDDILFVGPGAGFVTAPGLELRARAPVARLFAIKPPS